MTVGIFLRQIGVRGSDRVPDVARILPVERDTLLEVIEAVAAAGALKQILGHR
jgi:hypothetical protein